MPRDIGIVAGIGVGQRSVALAGNYRRGPRWGLISTGSDVLVEPGQGPPPEIGPVRGRGAPMPFPWIDDDLHHAPCTPEPGGQQGALLLVVTLPLTEQG